jgi:hypothetical protein
MRPWLSLALVAGCASAGQGDPNGAHPDAQQPIDAVLAPDACPDTDNDGACNDVDKCPGKDDRSDSDADMVPDGCDMCPGQDDKVDLNMNGRPDCTELMTRTIDVKKVGTNFWRGWQANATATHDTGNDNTITGTTGSTTYNSYFVFSLAGFTASNIAEVKLELEMESYVSTDANETLSIWDVTTPSATVETTGLNAAVYNDLGTGHKYGMATVTTTSVSATVPVSFTLDAQAATDLKGKLGSEFVVGVHLDVTPGYVRFSSAAEPRIARIIVKYTP